MLLPCPDIVQGLLPHTFLGYTAVPFYSEANKFELFFSAYSHFQRFYLFYVYEYLHESLESSCRCVSSTGVQMLAAYLAFYGGGGAGIWTLVLLLAWQTLYRPSLLPSFDCDILTQGFKALLIKYQPIVLTSGTSLGPITTLYPTIVVYHMKQYAYYVLFN